MEIRAIKEITVELPEITEGSEKQIKWAEDIRKDAKWFFERAENTMEETFHIWEPKAIEILTAHTDAKWWIDNRDVFGLRLDKLARKGIISEDLLEELEDANFAVIWG